MTVWEAYDVLGLDPAADMEEVRRAYKDLLKRYHPDNNVNISRQYFPKTLKTLNL